MEAGNLVIGYEEFCALRAALIPICPKFDAACFISSVFMLLPKDSMGRVSVHTFFDLVIWRIHLHRTRISFSSFDSAGNGLLTERELESYILQEIPASAQLSQLDDNFYSTYVVYAGASGLTPY